MTILNIPVDLLDLINDIVTHEEMEKEKTIEDSLEYLYDYDYSEYPENNNHDEFNEWNTVIKIDL